MGKFLKITLVFGIIALVMVFIILGIGTVSSMNSQISELENKANLIETRRETTLDQVTSLQAAKTKLSNEIALEIESISQQNLQKQSASQSAAEQAKLLEQQRIAKEQAAAQAAQIAAQQVAAQQAAAQAAAQKKVTVRKTSAS